MAWFQDGTKLLVSGNATLGTKETSATFLISTISGNVQMLREDAWGAAISPDNSRIAVMNKSGDEIWQMGTAGEDSRRLLTIEPGYVVHRLVWSPDGRWLAFLTSTPNIDESAIQALEVETGKVRTVIDDRRLQDLLWVPDGRLLFVLSEPPPNELDSNIWETRISARTAEVVGTPRRLTNWIGLSTRDIDLSGDGKRLLVSKRHQQSDVYVGQLEDGGARLKDARKLTVDDRIDWPGGWTRDGKSLLFHSDRNGTLDLFRQSLDTHRPEIISAGTYEKRWPQLSPDGSSIVYLTWERRSDGLPSKTGRIERIPAVGGASTTIMEVNGHPGHHILPRPRAIATGKGHPDFRCTAGGCVVSEVNSGQLVFTSFDPVLGKVKEVARAPVGYRDLTFWDLSHDGSLIVWGKRDRTAGRLSIIRVAGGTARELLVKDVNNLDAVGWAADAKSLFVVRFSTAGGVLFHVSMTGEARQLRKVTAQMERPMASPDGRYLAFAETTQNSNAWLIEDFQ